LTGYAEEIEGEDGWCTQEKIEGEDDCREGEIGDMRKMFCSCKRKRKEMDV
jgi:hypothetical protein